MASTGARHFASPDTTVGALDARAAANLVAAISDVALVVDQDGVIRDVAVGAADPPIGCSGWIGKPWVDTVTVESRVKIQELLEQAEVGTAGRWRQVNYASEQGIDVPVMHSVIRTSPTGGVIAVGRDLRDVAALQRRLVQAQQAMEHDYARLRSAEMRYRLLFREIADAVVVIDASDDMVVDANPAAIELLETTEQKLLGHRFPLSANGESAEAISVMLATARSAGRSDEIKVAGPRGKGQVRVSTSLFRQQGTAYFLVRIAPASGASADRAHLARSARMTDVISTLPDGFVVTAESGQILAANQAFLDMVQLPTESQARGASIDRWLGRPGVEFSVISANLKQHGSVRLYTTQLQGELGLATMVELSAVLVPEGDQRLFGFMLRNVGRRLSAGDAVIGAQVPRSVEDLAELIGQVPLKEIVRQTTDLIERLCIESALQLTGDNRASAAEMLGISRQALYTKLRRYGVGEAEPETAN